MNSHARTHFFWLLSVVTFLLFLALCTEPRAQPGHWVLGVKTESIDINRRAGDPPGQFRRAQPPPSPPFYVLRITDVMKGSDAEKAGLEEGDMIVSINGQRVMKPEQLERLVRGSNGVLKLRMRDYETETGYKLKTIKLGGPGGPVRKGNNPDREKVVPSTNETDEIFI